MNVNVDAKNIGEIIKSLPYKAIMLLISVISALLIFLPDVALKKMFLLDFRDKIGTFLGVLFIFSTCITAYLFISPKVRDRRIKKALSGKQAKKKIEELSDTEKRIIVYMYHNQGEHINLPRTSSAVVHLKSLLMISEASSIGSQVLTVQLFPYFLQQWVIKSLEENPDLLKGVPNRLPKEIQEYSDYISF